MASPDDLLSMFMSMGTSEHEALVEQFMSIVPGVQREAAVFFLEANSWNLQAALGSFMEQGGQSQLSQSLERPEAEFICDITIGEGEAVPPGQVFQKTWRLRNSGVDAWPPHCALSFIQGVRLDAPNFVHVPALEPGDIVDVSVNMRAPLATGLYHGSWRLCWEENGAPNYFGEQIWVIITVEAGGLLGLTQKMHSTSFDVDHHSSAVVVSSGIISGGVGGMDQDGAGPLMSALHPHPLAPQPGRMMGWLCEARAHPQGCHRGAAEQNVGLPHYVCAVGCLFRLCPACVQLEPPDFGLGMPGQHMTQIPSFGSLSSHRFGAFTNPMVYLVTLSFLLSTVGMIWDWGYKSIYI